MAKLTSLVLTGALMILPVKSSNVCSSPSYSRDIKNMEDYLSTSKESDPIFHYKITLFDYLDALKEAGELKKIEACKKEIKKDYAKIMTHLNTLISSSDNPSELIAFKNSIKDKVISESVSF